MSSSDSSKAGVGQTKEAAARTAEVEETSVFSLEL